MICPVENVGKDKLMEGDKGGGICFFLRPSCSQRLVLSA